MSSVDWVGYGYAALVASGGVIGYVKAGMTVLLDANILLGYNTLGLLLDVAIQNFFLREGPLTPIFGVPNT